MCKYNNKTVFGFNEMQGPFQKYHECSDSSGCSQIVVPEIRVGVYAYDDPEKKERRTWFYNSAIGSDEDNPARNSLIQANFEQLLYAKANNLPFALLNRQGNCNNNHFMSVEVYYKYPKPEK